MIPIVSPPRAEPSPARGVIRHLETADEVEKGEVWIGHLGDRRFKLAPSTVDAILSGSCASYGVTKLERWSRTKAVDIPSLEVIEAPSEVFATAPDPALESFFEGMVAEEDDSLSEASLARLKRYFMAAAAFRSDQLTPMTTRLQLDLAAAQKTSTALLEKMHAAAPTD